LVTGGAGYIATHTIICLLEAGFDVTVVDNLINSSEEGLNRVRKICHLEASSPRLRFFRVDLCDKPALERVFVESGCRFHACIHFAGLKAVGESVQKPLLYYHNNIASTLNLLDLLDKHSCHSLVFSSSATVRFNIIDNLLPLDSFADRFTEKLRKCRSPKTLPSAYPSPIHMARQNI
jgi:UDP-glucose 4-epimerase